MGRSYHCNVSIQANMKISGKTLLAIDRLFWMPYRLAGLLLRDLSSTEEKGSGHIVVIKFMGLGSIVQLASLCEKNHVDKGAITFLTLASNLEICNRVGFRNTMLIRTTNILLFAKDCWITLSYAYRQKPELIIDFERCSCSVGLFCTILTFLGKSKSISFESKRRINSSRQSIYPVDEFNQEQLFMKGIALMPTVSNETLEKIVTIKPLKILLNINASNYLLARRYPIDSFVTIINSLHAWDARLEFYLTGNHEERQYVNLLIEKLPRLPMHNICGNWTIEKLWNELSDCALLITGDSGPLHIAAYMGVTTIAIWGPTQPEHFGYSEEDNLHHISLKLPCSPCFKHPSSLPAVACHGKIDCLKNMSPSLISKKAIHILSSQRLSRSIHIPIIIASNTNSQLQPA
jgi:Glycosyltransferase family 9 (heptosyltransferase)